MSKQVKLFTSILVIVVVGLVFFSNWQGNTFSNKVVATKESQKPTTNSEKPVAPEKNPPGDIPDSQVFIKFIALDNSYELKVPEGWARTNNGPNVSFIDKFDGLQVIVTEASTAPTVESVRSKQIEELLKNGRAVRITMLKNIRFANSTAILVAYESNSAPDTVTGKQIRLENNSYLFYKNGKLATLTLWAPMGADNVDQWKLISTSFRWW
jgi:hypothetical protein